MAAAPIPMQNQTNHHVEGICKTKFFYGNETNRSDQLKVITYVFRIIMSVTQYEISYVCQGIKCRENKRHITSVIPSARASH